MAKRKRLPGWATTITPLSKTIALLLFILLPFLGFYFGRMYQKAVDQANTPVPTMFAPASSMPSDIPHDVQNLQR